MATKQKSDLIQDGDSLKSAHYEGSNVDIQVYDDGFGSLWIHRNSIGISGIVRAQSWEDAYSICEDEFFPEADETVEEIIKEYGFKREHRKVVKDSSAVGHTCDVTTEDLRYGRTCPACGKPVGEHLGVKERFEVYPDDYPESNGGRLLPEFVRWATIETPDSDAWMENELFQEGFGFRNNGPNARDVLKHGIYSKDLNGDSLDELTSELVKDLRIVLVIERVEDDSMEDES